MAVAGLSADGEWWGSRGWWTHAISADGRWRWTGQTWASTGGLTPPDCLETMNPQALPANRRGRMTWRQALGFIPKVLLDELAILALGAGCLAGPIVLVILLAIALVTLPVAIILLLVEALLGVRPEEGPLGKVERRAISVGETRVAARRKQIERLTEGAPHRLYLSRITSSLVNYERLGLTVTS